MSDAHQDVEDQIREVFEAIDKNDDDTIDVTELGEALKGIGVAMAGHQVRGLIDQLGVEKLNFDQFKSLCVEQKNKVNFGAMYTKALSTRKDLNTHGGMSEASVEGTTHSIKKEEEKAFSDWINRNLESDADCERYNLPMPETKLYENCKDGVILCKLINLAVDETIDGRTINHDVKNRYKRTENQVLALNSARAIGCTVVNIGPDDVEKGKPHLILGLLWQVIRIGLLNDINLSKHPNLHLLLEEGEDISVLQGLSPEAILLRWVNYHLDRAGVNRRINNFTEDIKDSEAYTYLLRQICPKDKDPDEQCDLSPLNEGDMTKRADAMLCQAQKIGCRSFVSPADVVRGNYKLNLAFVANLFNEYPALTTDVEIETETKNETREEKTYRNWMNSMNVNPRVNHLYSDLADGLVYFQLYDIVQEKSVDWNRVHTKWHAMKAKKVCEQLENCNYVVELGKNCKFSLVGIDGNNLRSCDECGTLALVWQLMRAYTLSVLSKITDKGTGDADIIAWANTKLKEAGKKTSVNKFQDRSLRDSKTIIDLIDAVKPGAVNYTLVKTVESEEDAMMNAKYAISLARKVGARVYALPEDIVEVKKNMVMTIFACLMYKDLSKQQNQ